MSALLRVALLLVLVATGCSATNNSDSASTTPGDTSPESLLPESTVAGSPASEHDAPADDAVVTAPGDDVIRLTPTETAGALSDPATAEVGVWSVLANLGIGVYTGRGERVLGGSETSEDDFWLYDFEVPALVRMATSPAAPFAVTHSRTSEVGFEGTSDDLLSFYRDTYGGVPEAYLVQLFEAAGVVFEGDLELTPFEEWLLLLDTFIPPNGGSDLQAAGADPPEERAMTALLSMGRSVEAVPAAYQNSCGNISFGKVQSFWGEAWRANAVDVPIVDHYYATHGLMLISGVEATISAEAPSAHEGHDDDGTPVDFVAGVTLEYFPVPVVNLPVCGLLVNLDRPFLGPLAAVEVEWKPDDVLEEHGWFRDGYPVAYTDAGGEARLTYVPREEKSEGRGLEQKEVGAVTGAFNMRNALRALVQEPRILGFVPDWMPITGQAELEIKWHQANIRVSVFETDGTSVMEYEAWTCDGENWQASFEWSGQPGGAFIEMFADFDFELPDGGQAINPVGATGGIAVADVTLAMTIPYNFEFTLDGSDPFAVVGINRQPGGGISSPAGGQIPFPATSFPEFDFVAPLEENLDCPD